jgi:Big-like domain-containing protein
MTFVTLSARARMRTALILGAASFLGVGCSDSSHPVSHDPTAIAVVSGSSQSGVIGSALTQPLVVSVTDAGGSGVSGATVNFFVSVGTGTVSPTGAVTDAQGHASTQLTLGSTAGSVEVTAAVAGTTLSARFAATAATVVASSCAVGDTLRLSVGQVVTPLASSTICLPGGTGGSDYALVPFNGSPVASGQSTISITGIGITSVSSPTLSAASAGGLVRSLATSGTDLSTPRLRSVAFDRKLRAMERTALTPRLAAARRWFATRQRPGGVLRDAIPASTSVGALLRLNANADNPCDSASIQIGRVAAITNTAIIVADTTNPAGGFTDAEYAGFGAAFDTLVNPLDTRNFGLPSDIDGNGRIVLFFTKSVNQLTPRNSSFYVGGFFFARDLFPTTATATLDGCAGSNVGEMFYLLVPDPQGTINGNTFAKSFVNTNTVATVGHEYQHLINASRRLYVNTAATDFEEVWLNEGLSHVAEELLFYATSGLSPRQDLTVNTLRSSATTVAAFNNYGINNFGRYDEYLASPSTSSPYADDDSLSTRGATWSFLRYAADQQSGAETAFWQALDNSTTTGLANLQQVIGSDLTSLLRDWSTSNLSDDVTGVLARYQQPSWNMRSVFSALTGAYPLVTNSLVNGVTSTANVVGGGAAYFRFGVAGGATATVQWPAVPAGVQMTLMRTH